MTANTESRRTFSGRDWTGILLGNVWLYGDARTRQVFPPETPEVIVARTLRQYDPEHYAYDEAALVTITRRLIGLGQKLAGEQFMAIP